MIPRIQVNAEISFVNLIDVMLVLLIIFMITTPTMHQMIEVELPKGKASRANITEGIVITIKKNGTILIDRDKLESKDFLNRFQSVWKKRSGEPVYINADLNVSYGAVVDILSIVKEIGGENVGLVIKEPAKTKTK